MMHRTAATLDESRNSGSAPLRSRPNVDRPSEEQAMEAAVRKFFEGYESLFNKALGGDIDMEAALNLYACEFIAASPMGVMAGRNDAQLKQTIKEAYARYRTLGMKGARVRNIRCVKIDDHHCMAHVAWRATYAGKGKHDIAIDFVVHYFIQRLDEGPKVFGWVSGDERALLSQHGII
jgi:hypothetical protein